MIRPEKAMQRFATIIRDRKGVAAVLIAILMIMFVGFAALAIDIGHLYLVQNELKNAADAGALAAARVLYIPDGTAVNTDANQVGYDAATSNTSEKNTKTGTLVPVDVNWAAGSNGGTDVERGHWSFAAKEFRPNDSTAAVRLGDYTTAELDAKWDFINAVRVKARRQTTPATSFFAKIFGFNNFTRGDKAVAWLGYAGTLEPEEVDEPIAICKQSITNPTGGMSCNVGRMISSSSGTGSETGGWTNFSQPCETANKNSVMPLLKCGGDSNPTTITLGQGVGTTNGMEQSVYDDLIQCWQKQAGLCNPNCPSVNSNNPADFPTAPWKVRLLVIDCDGNSVGTCSKALGSVELNILWVTRTGFKNSLSPIPVRMAGIPGVYNDWVSPGLTPLENWNSFASHFNLKDMDNSQATPEDKTLYFLPDCAVHIPTGDTGGENFGIMARIPKLVQ